MDGRAIPERKAVKAALRQTGMSARQVDALLRSGWAALVGETKAENDELRDQLAELKRRISA
jgi:hypothetical protein